MRRIIYRSTTTADSGRAADDLLGIARQSLARNGLDGVTGLLYGERDTFVQDIEGPDDSIADLLGLLSSDRRHRNMRIFVDSAITEREFHDWTMIYRDRHEDSTAFDERMRVVLAGVSPEIAEYFRSLQVS